MFIKLYGIFRGDYMAAEDPKIKSHRRFINGSQLIYYFVRDQAPDTGRDSSTVGSSCRYQGTLDVEADSVVLFSVFLICFRSRIQMLSYDSAEP